MNSPTAVLVVRCMIRDTVRQSLASRGFWLLLGLSGLCILLCLSVCVEGATAVRPPGEIELFGADRQPFTGLNDGPRRRSRWASGRSASSSGATPNRRVHVLQILLVMIVGRGRRHAAAAPVGERLPAGVSSAAGRVGAADQAGPALGLAGGQVPRRAGFRGHPDRRFRRGHLGGPRLPHRDLAPGLPRLHPPARAGVRRPLQLLRRCSPCGRGARSSASSARCCCGACARPSTSTAWPPSSAEDGAAAASPVADGLLEAGYWVLPKPVDLERISQRPLRPSGTSAPCRRCGRWSRAVPASSFRC